VGLGHAPCGEPLRDPLPARVRASLASRRISQQMVQGRGHSGHVAGRDDHPTLSERLCHVPHVRGDDGHPMAHGLEEHDRVVLGQRGQHEQVRGAQERGGIGHVPRQDQAYPGRTPPREPFQLRARGPLAEHDRGHGALPGLAGACEGAREDIEPLGAVEAPGTEDQPVPRIHAEPLAGPCTVGGHQAPSIHAVGYPDEAVGGDPVRVPQLGEATARDTHHTVSPPQSARVELLVETLTAVARQPAVVGGDERQPGQRCDRRRVHVPLGIMGVDRRVSPAPPDQRQQQPRIQRSVGGQAQRAHAATRQSVQEVRVRVSYVGDHPDVTGSIQPRQGRDQVQQHAVGPGALHRRSQVEDGLEAHGRSGGRASAARRRSSGSRTSRGCTG
jgi:hypothetical protein